MLILVGSLAAVGGAVVGLGVEYTRRWWRGSYEIIPGRDGATGLLQEARSARVKVREQQLEELKKREKTTEKEMSDIRHSLAVHAAVRAAEEAARKVLGKDEPKDEPKAEVKAEPKAEPTKAEPTKAEPAPIKMADVVNSIVEAVREKHPEMRPKAAPAKKPEVVTAE